MFGEHIFEVHFIVLADGGFVAFRHLEFVERNIRGHNGDDGLSALAGNFYFPVHFRKYGRFFRGAGFKEFFHTRETLRNVFFVGDSSHVEGTHGELRSRFSNGLSGNNSHRGSKVHRFAASEITAVTLLADAVECETGHDGAHTHRGYFVFFNEFECGFVDFGSRFYHHFTFGIEHVFSKRASENAVFKGFPDFFGLFASHEMGFFGSTIFFLNHDVLHGVHKTAGEVSGFGGFKSRV